VNTSIYYNQAQFSSTLNKHSGRHSGQNAWVARKGILIVEDDATAREFLRMIFDSEGYRVFAADGETQALKIWRQHFSEIDLLFTDLCIPYQTTGVQLAKRLRMEKSWLKVIYTSGFSPDIVDGEGDALIVNANFVCKPCPSSKLLKIVRNAFAQQDILSSN
jgi:DNA-binding NtrC family response regulator